MKYTINFITMLRLIGFLSSLNEQDECYYEAKMFANKLENLLINTDIRLFNIIQKAKEEYISNLPLTKNYELDYKPKDEYVFISAKTGYNNEQLLQKIESHINSNLKKVKLLIPFSNGEVINSLHKKYNFEENYSEEGILVQIDITEEDYGRYNKYIVEEVL